MMDFDNQAFRINNRWLPVIFRKLTEVKKGVVCGEFDFHRDKLKDLAIIVIEPGHATPLQSVVGGIKTIEGYLYGNGSLVIKRRNGSLESYTFDNEPHKVGVHFEIRIGDLMQWQASPDSYLIVSEICYPPFPQEEDRFLNITRGDLAWFQLDELE